MLHPKAFCLSSAVLNSASETSQIHPLLFIVTTPLVQTLPFNWNMAKLPQQVILTAAHPSFIQLILTMYL